MRRLLIPVALAAVAVMAGGTWLRFVHTGDPVRNARLLMMKNDLWGAQAELRSAIKADPGNVEAHVYLAQLQLQAADPVAAEKELKIAREMRDDPKVVAPLLAQAYLAQQRFADMLLELKGNAVDPADPAKAAKALALRAVAQLGLHDVAAARSSLDEAQRLAPDDQDILLSRAQVAVLEGDRAAAERQVDRTLALNANRADALVLKGQLLAVKGDQAGALDRFDRAVAAAPTSLSMLLERASQCLASGQDARARADVDKVLAAEPLNDAAIYLGMVLLVRAGQYADADLALGRLSTVIQRFPRGLYFQALIKSDLGQTEQAVEAARRYVARAPEDIDGVRLLARIEIGAGQPEQAVAVLTRAIAAGKATAETLNLLGQAYALQGKPQEASRSFEEAASLAPARSETLTRLALARMQMGNTPGATAALERSLQPEPKPTIAGEAQVAAALSTGDVGKAEAALDGLRQQAGNTETVGILTGMVKLAGMDLEGARSAFANTAQQFPGLKAAKVSLGKVLLLQNRRPEAEAVLDEVLAKDRADTEALTPLLQALLQDGKLPQAIVAFGAARAAAPSNLFLTAALADLHVRAKEPKAALELLHGALATDVAAPVLLAAQARAQVADGDPNGAKATYRQLLTGTPLSLEARQALVQLHLDTNDLDGAKKALREGLRLSPGNLEMMDALVSTEQRISGIPGALAVADDLRRNPDNLPASLLIKGDALMEVRRFTDAAAAFSDELKTNPSTVLALRAAGALASSGGQQAAAQQLQAWLSQHPDDADAAQMLGSLDIADGRIQDAEQHLQLVLGKRPNDPVALNNLAWAYQAKGDLRARGLAQRAYLLAPFGETSDTLGWIMANDGDAQAALPLLQTAALQRPNDKSVRYHLAVALGRAGKRDEASRMLQAILDDAAEFGERQAAQALLSQTQIGH